MNIRRTSLSNGEITSRTRTSSCSPAAFESGPISEVIEKSIRESLFEDSEAPYFPSMSSREEFWSDLNYLWQQVQQLPFLRIIDLDRESLEVKHDADGEIKAIATELLVQCSTKSEALSSCPYTSTPASSSSSIHYDNVHGSISREALLEESLGVASETRTLLAPSALMIQALRMKRSISPDLPTDADADADNAITIKQADWPAIVDLEKRFLAHFEPPRFLVLNDDEGEGANTDLQPSFTQCFNRVCSKLMSTVSTYFSH